jgi:hypothetical protein
MLQCSFGPVAAATSFETGRLVCADGPSFEAAALRIGTVDRYGPPLCASPRDGASRAPADSRIEDGSSRNCEFADAMRSDRELDSWRVTPSAAASTLPTRAAWQPSILLPDHLLEDLLVERQVGLDLRGRTFSFDFFFQSQDAASEIPVMHRVVGLSQSGAMPDSLCYRTLQSVHLIPA